MDARAARDLFPGARDGVFLDAACVGIAPRPAVEAVEAFARLTVRCAARDASTHHVSMDGMREAARAEGAILLGADPDDVALVESTTHGLNVVAQALRFEPGDNVVITDLEFLQVAIPWVKLQERGTIREVRQARNVRGALPPDAFERVVDRRTRAVVISSTEWCDGARLDVPAIAEICRANGAMLVVDAIQELGALRCDVRAWGADVVVAGGHKWLSAPFGCGLLWLSRDARERLEQTSFGYLDLAEPDGGWPRYFQTPAITPVRDYPFPETAKRFEIGGTANYPGAVGLAASLRLLNAIGPGAVEEHVLGLAGLLREGLARLGATIVSPAEPETWSGITTFVVSDSPAENERLLAALLDAGIRVSIRYTSGVGGLRVSTHVYNDEDDVERLLSGVARFLGR